MLAMMTALHSRKVWLSRADAIFRAAEGSPEGIVIAPTAPNV
jgi:hypothetical protein